MNRVELIRVLSSFLKSNKERISLGRPTIDARPTTLIPQYFSLLTYIFIKRHLNFHPLGPLHTILYHTRLVCCPWCLHETLSSCLHRRLHSSQVWELSALYCHFVVPTRCQIASVLMQHRIPGHQKELRLHSQLTHSLKSSALISCWA